MPLVINFQFRWTFPLASTLRTVVKKYLVRGFVQKFTPMAHVPHLFGPCTKHAPHLGGLGNRFLWQRKTAANVNKENVKKTSPQHSQHSQHFHIFHIGTPIVHLLVLVPKRLDQIQNFDLLSVSMVNVVAHVL